MRLKKGISILKKWALVIFVVAYVSVYIGLNFEVLPLGGAASICNYDMDCDDGDPCTEDICLDDGTCDHIDICPPNTTINPNGADWINENVPFELECSDEGGSNCDTTEYGIVDESDPCSFSQSATPTVHDEVQCSDDDWCKKDVCFRSIDGEGKQESDNRSDVFKIDKTDPVLTCDDCWEKTSTGFKFDPAVTDTGSGIGVFRTCLDSNCKEILCSSTTSSNCSYEIEKCELRRTDFWLEVEDKAGNKVTEKQGNIYIKGIEGCTCSYDNECMSGLCISGICIDLKAPQIFID